MGLADDLDAKSRALTVDEVIAELDEKDREAFVRALIGQNWSADALAKRLTEEGYPLTRYAIDRWRERNGA